MQQRIVLISGAPAVGKSTVAQALLYRLKNCAWVDGVQVLQINPARTDESTVRLVDTNMKCLVRNYLDAGYNYVIISWIMHRQEIIDDFVRAFSGPGVEFSLFTLYCDEATLKTRHEMDTFRPPIGEESLQCLRDSRETETVKVDTSLMAPHEVVDQLVGAIEAASDCHVPAPKVSLLSRAGSFLRGRSVGR